MQHLISRLLFGKIRFSENEEYFEFRYKFLCTLMALGISIVSLFITLSYTNLIQLKNNYVMMLWSFIAITIVTWRVLLLKKQWFAILMWAFEISTVLIFIAATIYAPDDELRIIWFYINIAAVYILAGNIHGFASGLLTGIIFIFGNFYIENPYSNHALITSEIFLFCLCLFFHFYTNRFSSYFNRLQESNQRLYQQATHDPLTNTLNARAYYQICQKMLTSSQLTGASQSVLFIDLDHFKNINDFYGHQAGDTVLQETAHCLQNHLRKTDVLGRVGGEEFSVFLPRTPLDEALTIAENLRKAIENLKPQSLSITASIGVANTKGYSGDTIAIIQRRADTAMYEAKKKGRNRVDVLR